MYFLIIVFVITFIIIYLIVHSKQKNKSHHIENNINEAYEIKKIHLIEFNETLLSYTDKVFDKFNDSENKKEKEYFLDVSFELNRLLYELDIDIESNIYTDEMTERCKEFLELLIELFETGK